MFRDFKPIRYHMFEVIVAKFWAFILYLNEVNPTIDSVNWEKYHWFRTSCVTILCENAGNIT